MFFRPHKDLVEVTAGELPIIDKPREAVFDRRHPQSNAKNRSFLHRDRLHELCFHLFPLWISLDAEHLARIPHAPDQTWRALSQPTTSTRGQEASLSRTAAASVASPSPGPQAARFQWDDTGSTREAWACVSAVEHRTP
ncbi:hypothetical protein ACH61_00655 [Rathayibacter tanaceti]|uniref:Uncharacterized protein n=1 Tax=Rathayibacter tanaceti TaxID=1671680 RepID=A0A162GJD6_9MICO|nr:hypothetical protein ACH61_00655 [Rathayibacter tanaceti]